MTIIWQEYSQLQLNIFEHRIYMNKEQHFHASDEKRNTTQQWNNNLKNPSSATKVRHGLRPEEYFETSQPGGSTNQALTQ